MRLGHRASLWIAGICGVVSIIGNITLSQSITRAQSESWRMTYHDASSSYEVGDLATALRFAGQTLALIETDASARPHDLALALNLKAVVLDLMGRAREAETLYRKALKVREESLAATDPLLAESLNNLAVLVGRLGHYAEAETLHKRALSIREQALGADHPDVAQSLNNLASVELALGRADRAGPLLRRAVTILAGDGRQGLTFLGNLVTVPEFGRSDPDADNGTVHIGKSGMAITTSPTPELMAPGAPSPTAIEPGSAAAADAESPNALPNGQSTIAPGSLSPDEATGPDMPMARQSDLAVTLLNLAMMQQTSLPAPRRSEAALLYRRAIELQEQALGASHPDLAVSLNNLAELSAIEGQYADAEDLHRRALAIREATLGPDDPLVAQSLTNLARLYSLMQRPQDAIPLLERSVAIGERLLGEEHPQLALSRRSLALARESIGEVGVALSIHRRATHSVLKHAVLSGADDVTPETGDHVSDGNLNFHLQSHISALYQAAKLGVESPEIARDESFELAQRLADSAAGQALTQLVARFSDGVGQRAQAIRQQQDLVALWRTLDAKLLAALGAGNDNRDDSLLAGLRVQLAAIEAELTQTTSALRESFPDYTQLVRPEPARIDELQKLLEPDEALLVVQSGRYGSYAWLVTQVETRWHRLESSRKVIAEQVGTLRCGLDQAAWRGSGWEVCQQLLQMQFDWDAFKSGRPLPFDLRAAHELYRTLLGPFEDLLAQKSHLLVVPTAPLSGLPFQVLIDRPATARVPPDARDYAEASWLIRRMAITVLPSAGSLKGLRARSLKSRAQRPYLAFANPLLTGRPSADNGHARRAKEARLKQTCPDDPGPAMSMEPMTFAGLEIPEALASLFRGNQADPDRLREIVPLPETADEVCTIGMLLGATADDVLLGEEATEASLKRLDRSHRLSDYRVLHFATHGFIAAETGRYADTLAEPSLLLTPPARASQEEDGLLTASEVAQLDLDADWVVLSACNTAASGGRDQPEALSGLARAFFYSGARSLLVSHWYVDSLAAVKITTAAFAELRRNPSMRQAEALRLSMLAAMRDADRPKTWLSAAHPTVWAPFSVVGEVAPER